MMNLTNYLSVDWYQFAAGGFAQIFCAKLTQSPDPHVITLHNVSSQALTPTNWEIGRLVAVKFPVVRTNEDTDEGNLTTIIKRWKREIEAGQRVQHPNILPFLGFCNNINPDHKDLIGIVLPYCSNGNARRYLSDHPQVDPFYILCGVAASLFALHSAAPPVVHGDIKAVNILIGDDGQALLADFGLSRICETKGFTTKSVMGTCRWMAVEMLKAISENKPIRTTTASDVWAFAMTILEILTMKSPFADFTFSGAVLVQVVTRNARPERPAGITDAIWTLLEHCWQEEPHARPDASHAGLVLDLLHERAIGDSDSHAVSQILSGCWDEIAPPMRGPRSSEDSSLPYKCKWLHCPMSFTTMEECIGHECVEFKERRTGSK